MKTDLAASLLGCRDEWCAMQSGNVACAPHVADAIRQQLTVLACSAEINCDPEAREAVERIAAILDAMAGPAVQRTAEKEVA